ncbi:MAG: nitroreductase family protein [Acidimicrobiales bacterium]|jgi:nitroreductase
MELDEVIRKRHMTRNFTGAPLDRTVVGELLALAMSAPSAGNTQGRDFVVLEGPVETARYWDATTDATWRDRSRRFAGMSRAPVVILAFSHPAAYVERYREPDKAGAGRDEVGWIVPYWHVDASFAVMTLLLAAADRGIGAAFLGNFRGEQTLKDALGIPTDRCWLGAVLLGEAATPDPPSTSAGRARRTVDDSVHRGRW